MNTNTAEVTTPDQLTALLAERVMHWRATPDRFLTGSRGWLPRWKFQPTKKLTDAIRLLEAAMPQEYSISAEAQGHFRVRLRIGGTAVQVLDKPKPLAICLALSAAYGIRVDL